MKRPGLVLAAFLLSTGFLSSGTASAGEEASNTAAGAAGPGDPIYVDLAPMVLPVIDGDRIQQVLQFTVTMQVADEKAAEHIRAEKPRLTDAFIQDLYGALDRRRVLDGKVLDIERLKDELKRVSLGVLGDNGVQDILIQRVSQRMM